MHRIVFREHFSNGVAMEALLINLLCLLGSCRQAKTVTKSHLTERKTLPGKMAVTKKTFKYRKHGCQQSPNIAVLLNEKQSQRLKFKWRKVCFP